MREFYNKVSIAGTLVKNGLERKSSDSGDYIGGNLTIRTADNSEHDVGVFSYKYKKDSNGNFTTDESKLYKGYETIIDEYKSIETHPDNPDVVSITSATFGIYDKKDETKGDLVSYTQLSTRFVNRVEAKDVATTPLVAKFEVEGIISSITDEMRKNEPTGNKKVILNVVTQRSEGTGKDTKYTPFSLFPLPLTLMPDMIEPFSSAGYFEGAFAKLSGILINTKEVNEVVEAQAFGEDLHKTFTNTVRRNEIKSGSKPVSIYEVELTDDIVNQLKNKRKLKLEEVKSGKVSSTNSESAPSAPPVNPFSNPFAK